MIDIEYDPSKVELIDHMGSDSNIIAAAKASTLGERSLEGAKTTDQRRFIRFLLSEHHAGPFEAVVLTMRIQAPLFTMMQILRHRSFSYSMESARYREVGSRFYVPAYDRPLGQIGKTGDYKFEHLDDEAGPRSRFRIEEHMLHSAKVYDELIEEGVAKEVARMVLPQATMSTLYMTGNLRNWLNFLVLRNEDHAQYEIRDVAIQVEALLKHVAPVTMAEWPKFDRPQL